MTEVAEGAVRPLIDNTAGRRPVGLLLVAIPVFLMIWLVIWPAINAIGRTVWRTGANGGTGFDLSSYGFFFSDRYSLDNLAVTLWTTMVCAISVHWNTPRTASRIMSATLPTGIAAVAGVSVTSEPRPSSSGMSASQ